MNELIYRPQHKPKQELINDFVIRLAEYQKIMRNIGGEKLSTIPQHIILQGMRGMGKTTLMHRVFYELDNSYRTKKLVPVIFSEEQYSVRTLYKLWEEVALYLEDKEGGYAGVWYQMQDAQVLDDYEEQCFEILKRYINKQKHRLILFIDNFGIMVDKFAKSEQQRLREILIDFKGIKIIGGSSVLLESFYKYDKPFFDFFKVIKLDKLSSEEVKTLLARLGKKRNTDVVENIIKNQPGRLESLRILTGGVPRTIVMLFEIFLDEKNGNSIDDLRKLLDDVTPLYKHRMDELPAQQQEIVDKLALNWDGMSVAELAKKTRMESKAISAQLNNLVKSNIVSANKSTGKNKFYQLQERFFNIWYLMQHAPRNARRKVIWLTRFLEMWCDHSTLASSANHFISRMKKEKLHPDYISTMAHAYATVDGLDIETHDSMINVARDVLGQSGISEELPATFSDFENKFLELIKLKKYSEAINHINRSNLPDSIHYFFLGNTFQQKGDTLRAIDEYKKSANKEFTLAMFNLGILYKGLEEYDQAINFYTKASIKGDTRAMINLGLMYADKLENFERALHFLKQANDIKESRETLFNLGYLYDVKLNDFEQAKLFYSKAIEKDSVGSMFNMGLHFKGLEDFKQAIPYFKMAAERKDLNALSNLGEIYLRQSDFTNASDIVEQLVAIDDEREAYNYLLVFVGTAVALGYKNYALKLFQKEEYQFKDRLKVIYYALMKLMEDEYPNEIKKMGAELEEPVAEMLIQLEEFKKTLNEF